MKQIVKWAAEGAMKGKVLPSILQRRTRVSCRGMVVPVSVREIANQGGTADIDSSLTDVFLSGIF